MRKLFPILALLSLAMTACAGPNADEFRQRDVQGNTACIHFGSGYTDDGSVGRTNLTKAAEHGLASSTESIRNAVSTDSNAKPVITDQAAFRKACQQQGMSFK